MRPLSPREIRALAPEAVARGEWQVRWIQQARPNQIPPGDDDWDIWAIIAGRGYGKTRTGAETLAGWATAQSDTRWLVSGRTTAEMRAVCFEGESGLLNVIPDNLIADYNKSLFELTVRTIGGGTSLIKGVGADKPDAFRGPQWHGAWLDEFAAWRYMSESWSNIAMSLRLGNRPRTIITTTPRPKPLIRQMVDGKMEVVVRVTRGSSYENMANLAPSFAKQLKQYEGTTIGRQEIHGEVLDAEESAIIRRSWWQLWGVGIDTRGQVVLPKFEHIVMSLDTAFSEKTYDQKTGERDPTACSVWGIFQVSKGKDPVTGAQLGGYGAMLLDVWEDHVGLPDLIARVKREMEVRYGDEEQEAVIRPSVGSRKPDIAGRKPDLILIEEKGSGISLRQMLAQERIHTAAYNPGRADKLQRLHAVSHLFAGGVVYVPESVKNRGKPMGFAEKLMSQVCSYSGPGSTEHDDHVDTTSQFLRYFASYSGVAVSVKPEPELYEPKGVGKPGNPYKR